SPIAGLTVTSPLSLDIVLKSPDAAFDHTVARSLTFVGSPAAPNDGKDLSKPIGAGPFLLQSSTPQEIRLVRNADYWDKPRPYLHSLIFRLVVFDQQRVDTVITGGADVTTTGSGPARSSGIHAGLKALTVTAPGGGQTLTWNTARLPFRDLTARRAVQ